MSEGRTLNNSFFSPTSKTHKNKEVPMKIGNLPSYIIHLHMVQIMLLLVYDK